MADYSVQSSPSTANELLFDRLLAKMHFIKPGIINAVKDGRCDVQPAAMLRTTTDGKVTYVNYPSLYDVPIVYPYAAGLQLTWPIKAGDPAILFFSDTTSDAFIDSKTIQPPVLGDNLVSCGARRHSLTDAFCIPGMAIAGESSTWDTQHIELRNKERTVRVSVSEGYVQIAAGTTIITVTSSGITCNRGGATFNVNDSSVQLVKGPSSVTVTDSTISCVAPSLISFNVGGRAYNWTP